MGVKTGAYLGSVRCVQTLRERCVMGEGGCWHLRSPYGKPYLASDHKTPVVRVYGQGDMSATKASWLVSHGALPPPGQIVYRVCGSHDCVNPAHLRCGTKADFGRFRAKSGIAKLTISARSLCVLGQTRLRQRKLTYEQAREIRASNESSHKLAPLFGVSASTIVAIRSGRRYRDVTAGASVFAWGGGA